MQHYFLTFLIMVVAIAAAIAQPITGTVTDVVGGSHATFSAIVSNLSQLFPSMGTQTNSVYPLQAYPPGVTYNGGIPTRGSQCGATLTPLGSGADDVPQIQAAINACSTNQYVQLGSGVFVIGHTTSINFGPPTGPAVDHITLKGVGPGPGGVIPDNQMSIPNVSLCGGPCTILYKNNWQTGGTSGMISINGGGTDLGLFDTPINLASNALQGSRTIVLSSTPGGNMAVGKLALISNLTGDISNPQSYAYMNNPDVWYGGQYTGCTPCFQFFSQPFRGIQQWVKITGVSGNTITIESPLANSYYTVYQAQLVSTSATQPTDIGIEEIYFYGGGGGAGNASIALCSGCWIRHIESHWAAGPISLSGCYRCEIRDSYIHENGQGNGITGLPTNGGNGYLTSFDVGTANSLSENNILWVGDKPMLMRASGGGNVHGYNYNDDQWDQGAPPSAEAGINAGHYGIPSFETFEGNRSHRFTGDSFWGNSIYITAFRNHLTGIRGGYGGLNTYVSPTSYAWCDCWSRSAVQLQAFQYYNNIIGNVLGIQSGSYTSATNQPVNNTTGLLPALSNTLAQTSMSYEYLAGTVNPDAVPTMYVLGNQTGQLGPPGFPGDPNLYQKTNRQGNFDWFTGTQIWYATYGGMGTTSTGTSVTIPNSLYLPNLGASQPAFFTSSSYCPCTWPWVNPTTGATYILPARARFLSGTPNVL